MRILFVSRAFPPVVGGIERQNHEIFRALGKKTEIIPVVNRRGKKFIPLFLPIVLFKLFQARKEYDVILLGDGVLAAVAWVFKLFSARPVIAILHGLDVTYANFFYRKVWVNYFFRDIDLFIAVGNETVKQAEARGIPGHKLRFISNGVDTSLNFPHYTGNDLSRLLGFQPQGAVLLTLGRLVKRKGVSWFIQNVVPQLDSSITYLVAGTGADETDIKRSIANAGAVKRIIFLGAVSEDEKNVLLSTADLFIQPNIPVKNDMEGFGLVVLEAAMHGTFVVASRLEGLEDAIVEGCNGTLVEAGNADDYKVTVERLLANPEMLQKKAADAREFVNTRFDWDNIADQYFQVIEDTVLAPPHPR